ncbi:MAG: glycoside hydrolase family 5 protein [Lachnospiraceae bacterium]|nr:glycoside hydrolase family 5 protein [Lachnospiraceae bacterium]
MADLSVLTEDREESDREATDLTLPDNTDKISEENNIATSDNDIKETKEDPSEEVAPVEAVIDEQLQFKVIEHEDDDTSGLTGALAFVRKLRLGWNLGNTMDATNSANGGANLNLETAWCGEKTTPQMIDVLKESGFKSVRVPVSWHNHVDKDFNIDPLWLARVKEIVDYVIDRDMYCTINIHHDNMKEYIYPTTEYLDQSKRYVGRIWEQVGETFKDYDDHLIFESLNEPRLVGTANEWYLSNNDMCRDAVNCINELNQLFVDTVRAQGGNNAERYLLVPGYAGQWGAATSDDFVIPTDTADNRILIEVHAYSPENFALTAPTEASSTDIFDETSGKSVGGINSMVARLKEKFINKGIGVVIDEFGSRDKSGNTEDRAKHAAYYVKKAREAGITCFVWDNHVFFGSGERFGLLDRKTNTIRYPEIMQALFDNCQ